MKPWELLRAVWGSGAQRVWVDKQGMARAKWAGKAPDHIRPPFLEGKEALGSWLEGQARTGVRYLWSSVQGDLLAVADGEFSASKVPSGVVCYIGLEIQELKEIEGEDALRIIHEAKRLFGGRVKRETLADLLKAS